MVMDGLVAMLGCMVLLFLPLTFTKLPGVSFNFPKVSVALFNRAFG